MGNKLISNNGRFRNDGNASCQPPLLNTSRLTELRCLCQADFDNICWFTSHHKVQGEHIPHELGVVADGVSNLSDTTAELEGMTAMSGKLLNLALRLIP